VSRIRAHLTYANVMATIAVFIALGGVAYAVDTVGSSDVINESLLSEDIKNNEVGSQDLKNNAVQSVDVRNGSLTGQDIEPQSGVDTCTGGATRFGPLCVRVPAVGSQGWSAAQDTCANLELRLPSLGEALALARNRDIPTSTESQFFWTEEFYSPQTDFRVWLVNDAGNISNDNKDVPYQVVCVTTPTN
jgi:hypothetical protein